MTSSDLIHDGFLIKKHIELKHGKAQKLSHIHDSKNAMEYYRYHGFQGALFLICDAILQFENLLTVLFIIIHGIAKTHIELTLYYPIIILISNVVISGLVNFIIDLKLKHACQVINNNEVQKFVISKKQKAFETKTWASLQPGDIIKIKDNQEFPADVLILDVKSQTNDHKCYVRGGYQNDYSFPLLKKSYEGTQNKTPGIKIPASQFVDQISGIVKYEYNYNGFFSGSYKLNNNPAAFNLTSENIAVRGSYLCQTKSVMCLVLNVGAQCMGSIFKGADTKTDLQTIYRNLMFKGKKSFDKTYYPMRLLQIILIVISIIISIIIEFQIKFQNNFSWHNFLDKIVYQYSDKGSESQYTIFIRDILAFSSGLFASLPLSYKLIMDIIVLIHSNFAEWDYNTIPSSLKFNKGITMKALGNVSNVFISKSAIMNQNVKKVKTVQIKRQQYFDNEGEVNQSGTNYNNNFPRNMDRRDSVSNQNSGFKNYQFPQQYPYRRQVDEMSSNSYYEQINPLNPLTQNQNEEDENIETLDDYLPNTIQFNPAFVNFTLNNDLTYSPSLREPIKDFMKGLTMCHQAFKRKKPSSYSQSLYKSIYYGEQAQLMLAHSYGFEFIARKNKTITINCQGSKERYDVIVVDTFSHFGQHLTVIVIKPYQTFNSGSTIYVKGPLVSMFEFIQDDDNSKHLYLNDLKKYAQSGVQPVMIAKKNLNNEETHELESRINEAMSLVKDQDEKIEISLLQYMTDLNPLGIIGLQEIFNSRDSLAVQDMLKNGVKVWFLSKDDEAEHVINCNAMKLLFQDSNPLVINGTSEKEVEDQIKSCLKFFTDDKEQEKIKHPSIKLSSQSLQNESKIHKLSESQRSNKQENEKSKNKNQQDQRVLIISGESLKYIFRDESMLKCFLTIATFSDFIVGCSITSDLKIDLMKYIKQFNTNGGYTVAVIGSQEDQNLILEADISVALKFRYQQSDTLIASDIVMKNLYSMTYLLFKHGTLCHRRLHKSTQLFLYRTFLLGAIFLYYMCQNVFSASIPFKQLMLLIFTIVVSTIQILIYGISYKDVGYDYLFRIFGEYKRNFTFQIFDAYDLLFQLFLAIFDAVLMFLISWQKDYLKLVDNGKLLNNDGLQLYYGLCLYILFTYQLTNQNEIVKTFHFLFVVINIFGILFMLDDEYLIGIRCFIACPSAIIYLVFVILVCTIRNYTFDVLRKKILPWSRSRFEFYTDVEDKLYLEEYEDPYQEFYLDNCKVDYEDIKKKLSQNKITIVNQNLMKLQRSDSMDIIIEKLNENLFGSSNKKIQDQTILNWFSLKFNDQNKEMEYIDMRVKEKIDRFRKVLIILISFNLVQAIKEVIVSSLDYIQFISFYFYLGYLLIALFMYFVTYRLQSRIQLANLIFAITLAIFYSICYYYMDMIEFSMFFNIIAFVFSFMGTYIRIYFLLAISLYILDLNLVNAYFKQNQGDSNEIKQEINQDFVIPYISIIWLIFILMWFIHSYWEERNRKLQFWFRLKKLKELTKLKQILHILLPAIVRERVNQGQRYIADDQAEVTIIFCDISDFDKIVQMFSGKELCEWLDHMYNAFDQLCEYHGLQKIETVGKTYMACGGLKQQEKKVDQRLVSKHHCERITEFAFNIQKFVNTQHLKDGSQVKVKIGIHSGQVVSGVVGESKPQFSLIGDTVNKTSRVCANCASGRILMSRETHRLLETYSQMFYYEKISVFFKGIGQEEAFYVHIKRAHGALKLHYRRDQIKQRERSPSLQTPSKAKFDIKNAANNNKIVPIQRRVSPDGQDALNVINGQPIETSRSFIQSDKSDNIDPLQLLNQSSDSEHFGDDDSFTGDHIYRKFEEQDDRQIFKNPLENTKYNLVERPNYLLQFSGTSHQQSLEDQFRLDILIKNKWVKTLFFIAFVIFNKIEITYFALEYKEFQEIMTTISAIYFFGFLQLRSILNIYIQGFIVWIAIICSHWDKLSVKSFSFIFEYAYFMFLLIFLNHEKEMMMRKFHNYEKILDFDIKQTNDLLSNLVPPQVLQGIKNDQKVVDELEDVTLLFTDMVRFTDFSKNVKNPKEVVKLLSELFTRFDQLCVNNQVYKVHTIGDCYVILGYNGHIAQSERTPQIKAQEAWNVIKTGFEMIEIIQDVRENSDNADLKELDMRIGIHTGRIVAGIIGTKIVRYDIFGADVLIANKMESNGIPGQVVISEDTKKTLSAMPELLETLNFQHHKIVEFEAIDKRVDSFIVQPKSISENDSVSDGSDFESDESYDAQNDDIKNTQKKFSDNLEQIEEEIKEENKSEIFDN